MNGDDAIGNSESNAAGILQHLQHSGDIRLPFHFTTEMQGGHAWFVYHIHIVPAGKFIHDHSEGSIVKNKFAVFQAISCFTSASSMVTALSEATSFLPGDSRFDLL